MKNYYEILGVPKDADEETLKRARRKHARKLHPDREGGDSDGMAEINKAYETLSDPNKRAYYDETGLDMPAGPQTTEEKARFMLREIIAFESDEPGNLVSRVKTKLNEIEKKAKQLVKEGDEIVARMLRRRDGDVVKKRGKPIQHDDVVYESIEHALSQVREKHAQFAGLLAQVKIAKKLFKEYESAEEEYIEPEEGGGMSEMLAQLVSFGSGSRRAR